MGSKLHDASGIEGSTKGHMGSINVYTNKKDRQNISSLHSLQREDVQIN